MSLERLNNKEKHYRMGVEALVAVLGNNICDCVPLFYNDKI